MATNVRTAARHSNQESIPRAPQSPHNSKADRVAGAQAPGSRAGGEERRRSQRVLLRIRANVYVNLKGQQATLEVRTLSVNPFGAMIISAENLPAQTRLVIENTVTQERIGCCVVRSAKEMPDGFHIPIQFDLPAPKFWMIDFPPDDWRLTDDV